MHAIVMVGGKGARLAPLTQHRPKALVRLGPYSILEILLRRLRACGFSRATLCVAHLHEMIRAEFGDGSGTGLAIDYCFEDRPLGTAGGLRGVTDWTGPALVLNGDLLTTMDYGEVHRAHLRGGGIFTVVFQRYEVAAAVGLVSVRDGLVREIREKPAFAWNVSTGVYVADPAVRRYLPADGPLDMPSLISRLVRGGETVLGHGFDGAWHDIGTPPALEHARKAFLADPGGYLGPGTAGDPHPGTLVRVRPAPVTEPAIGTAA